MAKIIITCAVTGGGHTPTMSDAPSNAPQVEKIARILRGMGHEPATPAEACAMLGLKGGDRLEF